MPTIADDAQAPSQRVISQKERLTHWLANAAAIAGLIMLFLQVRGDHKATAKQAAMDAATEQRMHDTLKERLADDEELSAAIIRNLPAKARRELQEMRREQLRSQRDQQQ